MPLTFDLPLEQCKIYEGSNPRPADFDEFWDKALAEMRSTKANLELVPAEFQVPGVECFHLYFKGVGGARVHAKLLHPRNASSSASCHPSLPWLFRRFR